MHKLEQWNFKIQEKRKQTTWRQFLREVGSWYPVVLYKYDGRVSCFPDIDRLKLSGVKEFQEIRGTGVIAEEGQSFFETFDLLMKKNALPCIWHIGENENSEFASMIYGAKNAYLSTEVIFASNVVYSACVKDNSDMVLNSVNVIANNSNVYYANTVTNSHNIFYCTGVVSSSDLRFCANMQGCAHCIACEGLENQSYCIQNKQYSKEEYEALKGKILSQKDSFAGWFEGLNFPKNLACENVQGVALTKCLDVSSAAWCHDLKQSAKTMFAGGGNNTDFYDVILAGIPSGEHFYGVVGAGGCTHLYCSTEVITSSYIYYSIFLEGCSYCLGCIGLKNKSYCIFNKQYEKEKWYEKVNEIFSQMEQEGTLGDFFPGNINPFYFNDTVASLIDSTFTQDEVVSLGHARRDEKIKVDVPQGVDVVSTSDLDQFEGTDENDQRTIDPEILKKVIQDHNGNYYRIIPMEYKFLKKYGLPLPRKHRLERLKELFLIQ